MATHHPRLVNKQFNSPIKLYSPDNVRQILDKETQVLYNGAVGIDFHQLSKPANLKNSAVLRMLEEEEHRKRNGQPSLKQVVWPPPQDECEYFTNGDNPVQTQVYPSQQTPSPQRGVSPQQPPSPQPYSGQQQAKGWAPVPSPQVQYQPQVTQAFRPVQPPPSTITLRQTPPISQAPQPVYTSQPATASLRGGANMRGDQKWPPATVKAQVEQENEQRKMLAKGPAFRPRKVKKDYSSFFAQNALNSTYPGYKAPPGTQHYNDHDQPGVSSF